MADPIEETSKALTLLPGSLQEFAVYLLLLTLVSSFGAIWKLSQQLKTAKNNKDDKENEVFANQLTKLEKRVDEGFRAYNDLESKRDTKLEKAKDYNDARISKAIHEMTQQCVKAYSDLDLSKEKQEKMADKLNKVEYNLDRTMKDVDKLGGELRESRKEQRESIEELVKTQARLIGTINALLPKLGIDSQ